MTEPSSSAPESRPIPPEPRPTLRTARLLRQRPFWRLWGFALFCIVVVVLFRAVVLPFLLAIMVAYILAPAVGFLTSKQILGRKLPRSAAVLCCYFVVLGLIVLFFTAFLPRLSGDFARLFREAPSFFRKVNEEYVPRAGQWVDDHLGAGEPAGEVRSAERGSNIPSRPTVRAVGPTKWEIDLQGLELEVRAVEGGYRVAPALEVPPEPGVGRWERGLKLWIAGTVKSSESHLKDAIVFGQMFLSGVLKAFATFILVLMVAAFLLVDLERVRFFLRSLVPLAYQGDLEVVLAGVDRGLSGVIRGQIIICVINGILTGLGLIIFRVKYSLLLAVVAAVMSLIPVFGSILSSIPIVAVALVSGPEGFSLARGLAVLAWICGIHLLEANVLNPKILGKAAKMHPVLVIFALLAGEQTFGIVGALLAVPVASVVQTLFVYFRRRAWTTSSPEPSTLP